MIASALEEIESEFSSLDRRLKSAQGAVEQILVSSERSDVIKSVRKSDDLPSDASLETLEYLETLDKDLDSHLSTLKESHSRLKNVCEESRKQLTELREFLRSVVAYAKENYQAEIPQRLSEALKEGKEEERSQETEKVGEEVVEQSEEIQKEVIEEPEENEVSNILSDKPNPLAFGLSKDTLEKMGYKFYNSQKDSSLQPLKEELSIQPAVTQEDTTLHKRTSAPEKPSLHSEYRVEPQDEETDDSTSFLAHQLHSHRCVSPPPSSRIRVRPQEITPGLFVRVRKSRGFKSITPEGPEGSLKEPSKKNNQPLLPSLHHKSVVGNPPVKRSVEDKENEDNAVGPPVMPKLYSREF